jgi:hypothetical protein
MMKAVLQSIKTEKISFGAQAHSRLDRRAVSLHNTANLTLLKVKH